MHRSRLKLGAYLYAGNEFDSGFVCGGPSFRKALDSVVIRDGNRGSCGRGREPDELRGSRATIRAGCMGMQIYQPPNHNSILSVRASQVNFGSPADRVIHGPGAQNVAPGSIRLWEPLTRCPPRNRLPEPCAACDISPFIDRAAADSLFWRLRAPNAAAAEARLETGCQSHLCAIHCR